MGIANSQTNSIETEEGEEGDKEEGDDGQVGGSKQNEEGEEEPTEAPQEESKSSPADILIKDEKGLSNMSAGEMIRFSQTKIVDHISCHKDCHEKVNELISNLIRIAKEKYQANDILNELFYDLQNMEDKE